MAEDNNGILRQPDIETRLNALESEQERLRQIISELATSSQPPANWSAVQGALQPIPVRPLSSVQWSHVAILLGVCILLLVVWVLL